MLVIAILCLAALWALGGVFVLAVCRAAGDGDAITVYDAAPQLELEREALPQLQLA